MDRQLYIEAVSEFKDKAAVVEMNVINGSKISSWKLRELRNIIEALEEYNDEIDRKEHFSISDEELGIGEATKSRFL